MLSWVCRRYRVRLSGARFLNRIGIIGGIGPETTVEYYRRILALYRRRNPDGSAPYIIINSLDMKKPLEMLTASKLEELATFLSEEVEKLARAGAAFAVVAANTPHLVFDAIAGNPVFRLSVSLKRPPKPRKRPRQVHG